jgi:hypoxanthine phosphoribosyltransferase
VKVLLSETDLSGGVNRIAQQVTAIYGRNPLTIVAVMTGSLVFLADLIRRLEMPIRVSLIQASSYRGGTSSGELAINDQVMLDIRGREVLVIDDIFDTGKTLAEIVCHLRLQEPTSVRSVVLLRKTGCQTVTQVPDLVGFEIPNEFVVGYGLDYEDQYRNLPFVAALQPSDLQSHRAI